jgi:hypothetical protein
MLVFVSTVFISGGHGCVSVADGVVLGLRDEECCSAGICSGRGDAECFVSKVALLEGEHAKAHQA